MVAYAVNNELALQEKKHNNLTSGNTRGTPFGEGKKTVQRVEK